MSANSAKQPSRRLDAAVAEQAAISRERAQALILAGQVKLNGDVQHKAGARVSHDAKLEIAGDQRYVSRGGFKLEHALRKFGWSPTGLRCLDVGASTGGFTDCLLQHGAAHVVALDVGYGHLAWSLRQDARVTVIERCNFRYADPAGLGARFPFITADVSFISLAKLAARFTTTLTPDGKLIALVKPQFEAGRGAVQRGGVVHDAATHAQVIAAVITALNAAGLSACQLAYSPLKGPAGNIEFLLGAQLAETCASAAVDVAGVVREAHETLA